MFRYYVLGIFTGAPHPFRATQLTKHNPLQRLAYLLVKLVINPLVWLSGLVSALLPGLARRCRRARARQRGPAAYDRRLHDADLPRCARLSRHHRPHPARPHQGDDHGVGRSRRVDMQARTPASPCEVDRPREPRRPDGRRVARPLGPALLPGGKSIVPAGVFSHRRAPR
ncbi:MAG: hypothetical protein M5R42_19955 [Rhodocyclaceae bacterium]|nr:hypothetical protein [Rhodocyclaceae bacterium]